MSPYKIIKVIYLQYTMAQSEYSHPSKELGAGQEKSGQTPDSVVPCSTCGTHDGIIWALPLALGNRTPVVLSTEANTAFLRLPFLGCLSLWRLLLSSAMSPALGIFSILGSPLKLRPSRHLSGNLTLPRIAWFRWFSETPVHAFMTLSWDDTKFCWQLKMEPALLG